MKEEPKIINVFTNHGLCPSCGCFVWWEWHFINTIGYVGNNEDPFGCYTIVVNSVTTKDGHRIGATQCSQCGQICIFHDGEMVYPRITTHVKPHELFTNYSKSQKLFNESLAVATDSPRAGLTLSRMCLECLANDILTELGETPKKEFSTNINKLLELDIINNRIKKLLDDTRVIGNKSTHNFNLIDTENEVTLDDCMLVWKATNHILESLKIAQDLESDISNLKDKVKEN